MFDDSWYDVAKDLCIALQQLQSARFLADASGNNDNTTAFQFYIVPSSNRQWVRERHGMRDVICFDRRTQLITIDQCLALPSRMRR